MVALYKIKAMTEIIIDKVHTKFLVKKLRDVFNPIVVTDDLETILTFDNDKGKGTFSIIALGNSILNIYFSGIVYETFDVRFYNPKQNALNFIYLQKGAIKIWHDNSQTELSNKNEQQLIYKSVLRDDEIISWTLNEVTEFNFIKLFDFSYQDNNGLITNHYNTGVVLDTSLKSFNKMTSLRSHLIPSDDVLIASDKVGKERSLELTEAIMRLLDIQISGIAMKDK